MDDVKFIEETIEKTGALADEQRTELNGLLEHVNDKSKIFQMMREVIFRV